MAPKHNPKNQRSGQQLHHSTPTTPQSTISPHANSSKSESPRSAEANSQPAPINVDPSIEASLVEDSLVEDDKLARVLALHARWDYENTEEQALEGESLKARQRTRCRELGLIIFGFPLHDPQVEAICTLFYEQRDLLLLAKTGFGKSFIFQLVPFLSARPGVVLTLMPLKLLQIEQSEMINRIPRGKGIVLNGENNNKRVLEDIARGGYTHIFTSPEIALSKKFKNCILDQPSFTDRLCLLAVDEIHLVEEWGKNFRPMYAEIEKVQKRIPCYVPLLGVSATLTKSVRTRVVEKAGFLPNYHLMQTSLDRLEIMQIHRFESLKFFQNAREAEAEVRKENCLNLFLRMMKKSGGKVYLHLVFAGVA